MKILRKTGIFAAIAILAALLMVLTACSGGEKEYKVTVKNAFGVPYTSGIIVQFLQNGEVIGMQACNESGEATVTLPTGDYDVQLSFTDSKAEYYYDETAKITADTALLDIVMAQKITAESESLFAQGEEYDSYPILDGCTYAEVNGGKMNYFRYTPTAAGNYSFSIVEGDASIGYYGAPHYVQATNLSEVVDGKFTISVSSTMIGTGDGGTSVYIIGVEAAEGTESCVIGIERIGDALWTVEDEPWNVYKATVELEKYTLPEGAELKEFDLTASSDEYKLVLNEDDGFYHLDSADGPLVLVRLAEDCEYIACFKTMLDRSGVVKYFFDENDEFEKKESYSECLLEYIEYVDDAEGVYPLTEDLKYIIQQRGGYVGWWEVGSNTFMFRDESGADITNINTDIAWLLMCCYIEG